MHLNDSRVTVPARIHCWSIASSLHERDSPFSRRSNQVRASTLVTCADSRLGRGALWAEPGRAAPVGEAGGNVLGLARGNAATTDIGLGAIGPRLVEPFLRILNMCPQLVHLTVTPVGLSRDSSSSYSVWHFSQRTSIGAGLPSNVPTWHEVPGY